MSAVISSTFQRAFGFLDTVSRHYAVLDTPSRTFFSEMDKMRIVGGRLVVSVPKRPTPTALKFGVWLKLQRTSRSLSREQIAQRIRPLVSMKVDQSLISRYESGRVPDWPMLAALGRVYGVPFFDLVQRLVSAMEFPGASDLLGQLGTDDESSKLHIPARGAHDVTAVSASEGLAEPQPHLTDVDAAAELAELAGGINAIATRLLARALGPNSDRPAKFRAGRQDTTAPGGRKRKAHRRSA